jgi:diaminohydroxyphosphoribosylaminopyrimidine deaminase/5-amino-6-(5-phosphoribosylamino)uracil reductase
MGASMDGGTAMASGESQWITGVDARSDVQAWRASSDAIVTGSGTVAADDCALTVRPCGNRFDSDDWSRALTAPSLRAVIDSRGITPPLAKVVTGDVPTLIFTKDATSLDVAMPSTVTQVKVPTDDGGLDLRQILLALGERGANEILIEAGPTLVGALERQNLIDQWLIYMAPVMLGPDARPLHSAHFSSLAHAPRYAIVSHDMIGDDLRIIMRPANRD